MSARASFLATCIALTGCGAPVVELAVFFDGEDEATAEVEAAMLDAEEILGLPLVQVDEGPITVEFVNSTGTVEGRHFKLKRCSHFIRTDYSGVTLAHEIGHALGLKHKRDGDNLMAPYIGDANVELEAWQQDKLEAGARRLQACL